MTRTGSRRARAGRPQRALRHSAQPCVACGRRTSTRAATQGSHALEKYDGAEHPHTVGKSSAADRTTGGGATVRSLARYSTSGHNVGWGSTTGCRQQAHGDRAPHHPVGACPSVGQRCLNRQALAESSAHHRFSPERGKVDPSRRTAAHRRVHGATAWPPDSGWWRRYPSHLTTEGGAGARADIGRMSVG